jgi:hypothetical protein
MGSRDVIGDAKSVVVKEGATQLNLILGAYSAAKDLEKASTAPFAAAIELCIGMPLADATVEKNTKELTSSLCLARGISF